MHITGLTSGQSYINELLKLETVASSNVRMQAGTAADQTPSIQTDDVVCWRSINRYPGLHTYTATLPYNVNVHVIVAPATARGAGQATVRSTQMNK